MHTTSKIAIPHFVRAILSLLQGLNPRSGSGNLPRSVLEKPMGVQKNPKNKPVVCYEEAVACKPCVGKSHFVIPFDHYSELVSNKGVLAVTSKVVTIYPDGDFETRNTLYHKIHLYND